MSRESQRQQLRAQARPPVRQISSTASFMHRQISNDKHARRIVQRNWTGQVNNTPTPGKSCFSERGPLGRPLGSRRTEVRKSGVNENFGVKIGTGDSFDMSFHTVLVVIGISLLVAWRLLLALSCFSARFSPLRSLEPKWLLKCTSWLTPGSNQPRVSK